VQSFFLLLASFTSILLLPVNVFDRASDVRLDLIDKKQALEIGPEGNFKHMHRFLIVA
jgi:hypothetical protein